MLSSESLVIDLTHHARQGMLGAAFGRESETLRVLEAMANTAAANKGSPVLVGEDGVGKFKIIESLAVACEEGETQGLMDDFQLLRLDIGTLLSAGSEVDDKLRHLIRFLRNERMAFLCVDDFHLLFDDSLKEPGVRIAAEILRPLLTNGILRFLGATTPQQYQKLIDREPGLTEHFIPVSVPPMTKEESYEVLVNIRADFELEHGIDIDDTALRAIVDRSEGLSAGRSLPGSAIDLLKRSSVRKKFMNLSEDTPLHTAKREASGAHYDHRLTEAVVNSVVELGEFAPSAIALPTPSKPKDRWEQIQERFEQQTVGQNKAISVVIDTLRQKSKGEDMKGDGPQAVLLFSGPKGSGKRHLSRLLAKNLFGSSRKLVRIDSTKMDLAMFPSALLAESKLLSHATDDSEDSDFNIEAVRLLCPARVLLFDAIEDIDEDQFIDIMSALVKGCFTGPDTPDIGLKNCIVVFCHNCEPKKDSGDGSSRPDAKELRAFLEKSLNPLFFNFVDCIAPFVSLTKKQVRRILEKKFERMKNEVEKEGVQLVVRKQTFKMIVEQSYDPKVGVSSVLLAFHKLVIEPMLKMAKHGKSPKSPIIHALSRDGKVDFRRDRRSSIRIDGKKGRGGVEPRIG